MSTGIAAELVSDLAEAGVKVSDVYDLVNSSSSYPSVIPVLVRWLPLARSDPRQQEGIVRALTVRTAGPGAVAAVKLELYKTESPILRWAQVNALATIVVPDRGNELAILAADRSLGDARQMAVLGLRRYPSAHSRELLISLLSEPGVALRACRAGAASAR
jgi:hypothetical protein